MLCLFLKVRYVRCNRGLREVTHTRRIRILLRDLCEVEFFWEVCFGERYTRLFIVFLESTLHYQIVDLEESFFTTSDCKSAKNGITAS